MFAFRDKKIKLAQRAFRDHFLGCAVGAKVIGNYLRHDKVEELFVAGLLHDIGKMVEMMFMPREFSRIASRVKEDDILMIEAENEILGYNHADIGKLVAQKWNLPAKLVEIIACHHQPQLAGGFAIEAAVVHLADIFCRALEMGSGGDDKIPPLNPQAWQSLKINSAALEPIMNAMSREYRDISAFIA